MIKFENNTLHIKGNTWELALELERIIRTFREDASEKYGEEAANALMEEVFAHAMKEESEVVADAAKFASEHKEEFEKFKEAKCQIANVVSHLAETLGKGEDNE